uniref:Uncharacterized protein n=1 Tax=Meloidogyne enterolobii TaxID=390850 RepID=A0A6V7UEM3_MELEN|nr:unnamed protein product [Meloidogyne enterolobii]
MRRKNKRVPLLTPKLQKPMKNADSICGQARSQLDIYYKHYSILLVFHAL